MNGQSFSRTQIPTGLGKQNISMYPAPTAALSECIAAGA